jgi:hypothetical protein
MTKMLRITATIILHANVSLKLMNFFLKERTAILKSKEIIYGYIMATDLLNITGSIFKK